MKTMFDTRMFAVAKNVSDSKRKARKLRREANKAKRNFREAPQYVRGMGKAFYLTREWRSLRWEVLSTSDGKCVMCGGSKKSTGRSMHVDHIFPRSTHPHLELVKSNLQVLCEDCNLGKGTQYWKPEAAPEKPRFSRSPAPRAHNPGVPNSTEPERLQTDG